MVGCASLVADGARVIPLVYMSDRFYSELAGALCGREHDAITPRLNRFSVEVPHD